MLEILYSKIKLLIKAAGKTEKQINSHLKQLLDFAKHSPNKRDYQLAIDEILREIRILRRWRSGLWIASVASLLISLIAWRDYMLVKNIKENQLGLRFADQAEFGSNGTEQHVGLSVIVDTEHLPSRTSKNQDPIAAEKAQDVSQRLPSLGRHYGVGPHQNLRLKTPPVPEDDGLTRWFVMPTKPYHERLGYIELSDRLGTLILKHWSERLKIGTTDGSARRYKNLNTFLIRAIGYDRGAPEQDVETSDSMLLWRVQFAEERNSKIVWNPREYQVLQTPSARVDMAPEYISFNGWSHIYVVSVGLGKFVSDPHPSGAIHRVNSYVRRLSFR